MLYVTCIIYIYLIYNILWSLVTADIDKALLCTENAVEVALDVRKYTVILVKGFNTCIRMYVHVKHILSVMYWFHYC